MSGVIVDNVARASGTIAATPGGLDWSTAVVTGSTVTVEAGRGYFINTTSNACTVTLPSSAEAGDQIVIADYARTWSTNAVTLDSNGLNFQGQADTYTVDYDTVGQSLNIVYSDSTKGWLPVSDDAVALVPVAPTTQKGIFAYGYGASSVVSLSNLINSSGVIASDVTGVGTARSAVAGATYGLDKGIFGFGDGNKAMTNLVSNSGVVASDTTGTGTGRVEPAASSYDGDKAIFAFGEYSAGFSVTRNLVNSSGVMAAEYGGDKAIFAYGSNGSGKLSMSNLVTNAGVIGSDVSGVGTARNYIKAARYGDDKAIFAFGAPSSGVTGVSNLVSNSGVVASDVSAVGTARRSPGACGYDGDKAAFAYGTDNSNNLSTKNLINSSGVVGSDVSGVGTARRDLAALGYSITA